MPQEISEISEIFIRKVLCSDNFPSVAWVASINNAFLGTSEEEKISL